MKYLLLILALLLAGCGHNPIKPEEKVVVKTEYVLKIPPKEMMTLPPEVQPINVQDPNLKQSDAAKWIGKNEERTNKLENMLIELAKFFNDEQAKLDEQAKKETK